MLYCPYMLNPQDVKIIQNITAKIKTLRLEQRLTQAELAKKAGINTNYYAKMERENPSLSVITLKKVLTALKVKSSDVLPF